MDSLQSIKGVGPKVLTVLKEKGINTINDVLIFLPVHYTEHKLADFDKEKSGQFIATVVGEVMITHLKNKKLVSFDISINDYVMKCSCYNMVYLKKTLTLGKKIVVFGSYKEQFQNFVLTKCEELSSYSEGIVPEYRIEGINDKNFSKIVDECLEKSVNSGFRSIIPEDFISKNGLVNEKDLVSIAHHPKDIDDVSKILKTLKYRELFIFALRLEIIRKNQRVTKKNGTKYDINLVKKFIETIPFSLTDSQKKVTNEIFTDFLLKKQMYRLLQGDVGSGKTIVAMISSYAVTTAGRQVAIMAPTEILAVQHYKLFSSYLSGFNVKVALLTSSTKKKEKDEILNELRTGAINIIIGTHALLGVNIEFHDLGFIVTDEQHRFGVLQRKALREKGNNPDILMMTATPIPRTLAMSVFADIDMSTISELPKGRKPVITRIHDVKKLDKVLDFAKTEIGLGHQVYIVCPMIEEGNLELAYAEKVYSDMKAYFKEIPVGLLHGKMSQSEKDENMTNFLQGNIKVLVSTTVIEVGVNVPNASTMIIMDAGQFGLSQLHQLRGRIGRGEDAGYCFLITNEKGNKERLEILVKTNNGFIISEEDLKQRGPGNLLGLEQAGMVKFAHADLISDFGLFQLAKADASEIMNKQEQFSYLLNLISKNLFSDKFD